MGLWLNVAFVATADRGSLEVALVEALAAHGRRRSQPAPRAVPLRDPMQYGSADTSPRWGFALLEGAAGWTVVKTAPLELLDEAGLLGLVAQRLGVAALQYDVFDGDSELVAEALPDGRRALSGFVGSDPTRRWGGAPPEDRVAARCHLVDLLPAADACERAAPGLRVTGTWLAPPKMRRDAASNPFWTSFAARQAQTRAWLAERCELTPLESSDRVTGAPRVVGDRWSLHPAQIVRAFAAGHPWLPIEGVRSAALALVLGGPSADRCANGPITQALLAHAPIEGARVVYADRAPGQRNA